MPFKNQELVTEPCVLILDAQEQIVLASTLTEETVKAASTIHLCQRNFKLLSRARGTF